MTDHWLFLLVVVYVNIVEGTLLTSWDILYLVIIGFDESVVGGIRV